VGLLRTDFDNLANLLKATCRGGSLLDRSLASYLTSYMIASQSEALASYGGSAV
jgi:hypothetical protein